MALRDLRGQALSSDALDSTLHVMQAIVDDMYTTATS